MAQHVQSPPPAPLPMLPGMRSNYYDQIGKTDFRKGQYLERMSVGKLASIERMPTTAFQSMTSAATAAKAHDVRPTTAPQQTPAMGRLPIPSSKYRVDASQPIWLTHDRLVLRFFAYFNEPIEYSDGRPGDRVRRVVICFYLSDRSISISEPRVVNSGMPQGEFMKRTIVRKGDKLNSFHRDNSSNDNLYTPEDFRVGGELRLYGRVFHIVDCDEATRRFYSEALNKTLETPRMYPDESGSKMDEIEELKAKLQTRTRELNASKAEATRKFHDLSQKVLRFYASWHDSHPLYPETRHFVLHYYLCDDTVEIIETRDGTRDRGRGQSRVLVSRRKLAREGEPEKRQHDGDDNAGYFITDRDLRCGEWLTVFSRKLLLEDCDAFTREYYLETHGVTQEKCKALAPDAPDAEPKWKLFQATQPPQSPIVSNFRGTTGYSANNISCMQSGFSAPIPEHQNRGRSLVTSICQNDELDGKQLRFRARFQGLPDSDINAQREFVVTFFLEDETIAVYEPRVRNSGVQGGRFLDRARFRKDARSSDPLSPAHYLATDMYVGAVLVFEFSPHQRLELVEADSQTLSYCESHPEIFRFSDSSAVLELVTKLWLRSSPRLDLRREWRQLDWNGTHSVNVEDMKRVLSLGGLAPSLNEQQVITLVRRFADSTGDDNNQFSEPFFAYDDFCDAISALVNSTSLAFDARDNTERVLCLKLIKIPDLRHILSYGHSAIGDLVRVTNERSCVLSKPEVETVASRFTTSSGKIDIHRLCDHVFQLLGDEQKPSNSGDNDDEAAFTNGHNTQGDEALPPALSTQSSIEDAGYTAPQSARKTVGHQQAASSSANPRVISLLQRVFAGKKYQLRRAFRDRDREKSGHLNEDDFMDAIISVAPQLSDDDSYILADAFFPTNNCFVDYPQLLDSAFHSVS